MTDMSCLPGARRRLAWRQADDEGLSDKVNNKELDSPMNAVQFSFMVSSLQRRESMKRGLRIAILFLILFVTVAAAVPGPCAVCLIGARVMTARHYKKIRRTFSRRY